MGPMRPDVVQLLDGITIRCDPGCQRGHRAIRFVQGLDGGFDAAHHRAIEFYLLSHVPIQCARYQPFHGLRDVIHQAWRAGIYRTDAGHFAFGGISRLIQRSQIRQRNVARRHAIRMQSANSLADFRDNRG